MKKRRQTACRNGESAWDRDAESSDLGQAEDFRSDRVAMLVFQPVDPKHLRNSRHPSASFSIAFCALCAQLARPANERYKSLVCVSCALCKKVSWTR
jgi:hypothetical protein